MLISMFANAPFNHLLVAWSLLLSMLDKPRTPLCEPSRDTGSSPSSDYVCLLLYVLLIAAALVLVIVAWIARELVKLRRLLDQSEKSRGACEAARSLTLTEATNAALVLIRTSVEEHEKRAAAWEETLEKRAAAWEETLEKHGAAWEETPEKRAAAWEETLEKHGAAWEETHEKRAAAWEETLEKHGAAWEETLEKRAAAWEETLEKHGAAWEETLEKHRGALLQTLADISGAAAPPDRSPSPKATAPPAPSNNGGSREGSGGALTDDAVDVDVSAETSVVPTTDGTDSPINRCIVYRSAPMVSPPDPLSLFGVSGDS